MSEGYNIGIDFGTENCTVSVFADNRVRSIPIDCGKKVLPSYIHIGDDAISVGRVAEMKKKTEPNRVIYGMKRMLGHTYDDVKFQDYVKNAPFEVKKSDNGNILLSVKGEYETFEYSPIELTAHVLSQAIGSAQEYLDGPISEAVITVPAYFNNVQRNDLINAGIVAGLEKVHLFSEPTAAAISYGLINPSETDMVLVFDLGAGTFDVSVIEVVGKTYTVMSCSGDSHLGGDDLTDLLMDTVVEDFQKAFGLDVRASAVDYVALRDAVNDAKESLSMVESVDIDEQIMDHEFHYVLTRASMELRCKPFFDRCMAKVDEALQRVFLSDDDITHVLMVGGSTNIPYLRNRIIERFGKKRVAMGINSVEAVSQGAAVIAGLSRDVVEKGFDFQVAMYTTTHNRGNTDSNMSKLQVNDITPMNIGIRVSNGELSTIIPANSSVPCRMRKEYQAHKDGQKRLKFRIFQGLEKMAKDCTMVSEVVVNIDNPGKAEDTRVEVTFSLDSNSTLYVEAMEMRTMKTVSKVVDMGSQVLDRESVYKMQNSLRQSIMKSSVFNKMEMERTKLQKQLGIARMRLDALDGPEAEMKKQQLQELIAWMKATPRPSAEELEAKKMLLDDLLSAN